MGQRQLRQEDIARRLGLSQKTVSRALVSPERVSPSTRMQVFAEVRRIGYRPKQGARGVITGSLEHVVLLCSTVTWASPISEALLVGLDDALSPAGASLQILRAPDEILRSESCADWLASRVGADGLLVNYDTNTPSTLIAAVESLGRPHVWLNAPSMPHAVCPDDRVAGRQAAEALLRLGHTRIAYADWMLEHHEWIHPSRKDRLIGYREAMNSAGLAPIEFIVDQTTPLLPRIRQLMALLKPTAVIGYSSMETDAAFIAAAGMGMEVPRDLSLATFHVSSFQCGIDIATWRPPMRAMGRASAERLLALMGGRVIDPYQPTLLPFTLEPGASMAPPSKPRPSSAVRRPGPGGPS